MLKKNTKKPMKAEAIVLILQVKPCFCRLGVHREGGIPGSLPQPAQTDLPPTAQ